MRIDAETGDKAVHHELHISVLASRPPPEGFCWVEQQSLMGQESYVTSDNSKEHFWSDVLQTNLFIQGLEFI